MFGVRVGKDLEVRLRNQRSSSSPAGGILALVALVLPLFAPGHLTGQAASAASAASVDDLPTVGVMDFTGFMMSEAGNSPFIGKAVTTMLISELSTREGMRVIERYRLQDLLDEQRLALSGRVEEMSAGEVGRIVGAQYMIEGGVTSAGDRLRIDIRAVEVETSEILEVQKLTDDPAELLAMVVRIADLFASKLELDAPSARPARQEIPVRSTIEFSRGVDYEDRGERERALEHYRAALEIYPDHADARAAIDRLEAGGGGGR